MTRSPHTWVLAVRLTLFTTLLSIAAHSAQGDPLGSDFQVNTYTTSTQRLPAVAMEAGGGFVVVWMSRNQDDSGYGVFGQRHDSMGAPAGSEFQVNTFTNTYQFVPAVAAESGGGFVVVWTGNAQEGSGSYGVLGQRFDSAGTPAGSEFHVNTYTFGTQFNPAVAAESGGGFVVVWGSYVQEAGNPGIFGQRFDSTGAPGGSEFHVNTYTTNGQYAPAVTAEAGGGFVVVWRSYQEGPGNQGIFGQRFDSAGTPAGSEFPVNTYTNSFQTSPAVAAEAGGGFVVVWMSYTQEGPYPGGYGVFGQRFDSVGAPTGSEFHANTYTNSAQEFPAVASHPDGGFVVAWEGNSQEGSGGDGVFGQLYDSAGAPVGSEFHVNTYTYSTQSNPAVAAGAGGSFVVVWNSNYQEGPYPGSYGVFGQRYGVAVDTATATVTATETATATVTATATPTAAGAAVCGVSPATGCSAAGKAIVKIKNSGDATKNQLLWKWLKGTVGTGDFDDPTMATTYAVCVYKDGGLIAEVDIESGANWAPLSSGFKYKHPTAANADGLFKAIVKEGTGNAKILIKAKGSNLVLPTVPLSPTTNVVVQMVKDATSGTECWESTFTSPYKDAAPLFKDKTP